MEEQNIQQKTSTTGVIIFLIIVLIISAGVLGYLYYDQVKEKNKIESEKNELINDFKILSDDYAMLKSDYDTINYQLTQRQVEIENLIGEIKTLKSTNAQIIRQYKKELGTLRDIMKSYIVQIDSLNTKNLQLQAENIEVKQQMEKINTELTKEKQIKDDLSAKVESGSKLTAKEIIVAPLTESGKEKDRISKIARIRTCFILRENRIASAGTKTIYLRITRPDDVVVTDSEQDLFDFEGKKIVFSAKRDIEYENQDIDVCIFWQNNGMLIPGNYTVSLYTEGYQIGATSFSIR